MTDDPENPWIELVLRGLAENLANKCPPGWGFALQLMEFETENVFYISNANRADVIKALRLLCDRLERELKEGSDS